MPTTRTRSRGPIHLVLVDDHKLVVEAISGELARFGIDVVGVAGSLAEFEALQPPRPDVVLMDYRLPDGTGADGCRAAKARWPWVHVLILTGYADDGTVVASFSAGADGFLLKSLGIAALVEAIERVMDGKPAMSATVVGVLARELGGMPPVRFVAAEPQPESLTPRQLAVLRLLARGASTESIATQLGVRPGTIRVHVEAIRRKFHASTRLEAVSRAIRHHVIEIAAI